MIYREFRKLLTLGEGITDAMEDLIPKSETQTDSEIQLTGMSLENVRKKKTASEAITKLSILPSIVIKYLYACKFMQIDKITCSEEQWFTA